MILALKSRLALLLWPLAFVLAFALGSLIPPVQSPDEHSHLTRAYMISKGHLSLINHPGASSGGMVDNALVAFVDNYMFRLAANPTARFTEYEKGLLGQLRWGAPERPYEVPGTSYYMPLVYAPHALGFWVGQTLNLSISNSYQLVRAFCLLSCFALLAWSFRLVRPPAVAAALLLLPMTMFQLLSPTLDGITTCLAVLVLSIFFRKLLADEDSSAAQSWVLAGGVALLASTRVQLWPLLALPFYLAWARRSPRDAIAGVAAILVAAGWLVYALTHTVDLRVPHTQSTGQLLLHYAARPFTFLRMVFDSMATSESSEAYEKSFLGILGWLDTWLPMWSYPMLWIGLALCALASALAVNWREAPAARAGLVVAAVACSLLVFLAMLLTWTPHPATTIRGVQGRYFIVPALMIAYALGATLAPRGPRWPGWVALSATAALSFYALIVTLLARYH
jgi:uncharacterized membrane protein